VVNITDKYEDAVFDDRDLSVVVTTFKQLGFALYSLNNYLKKQNAINEQLRKEIDELKESVEQGKKFSSLGKLVGGLVHEINNPLDGIIRYLNLSLDCMEEEGSSKEYLLEAKKGVSRIAQFVRSLLDFTWSLSSHLTEIDVNQMLEEALFLFNYYFTSYNIHLEKNLSADMPRVAAREGIKIVFNNIIRNACEAMKQTGGTFTVSTCVKNGKVEICFTDTGRGIPQDIKDRIFEPFFTTKNMGEGSGLGLAICQEIVQSYQGKISVRSKEGKGTVFLIQLPRIKEVNPGN
jgi:signal transduction histidine kinase